MGFGGLYGRGAKKQDPPIERDLYLTLEEIYHGCTKKMKISRRVRCLFFMNDHCFLPFLYINYLNVSSVGMVM